MRRRHWAAAALTLLLLWGAGGCQEAPAPDATADPPPEPSLGGAPVIAVAAPDKPMDWFEKALARQLRRELRRDGLRLEHLDCPRLRPRPSVDLTCTGHVSGIPAEVSVHVEQDGDRVDYQASVTAGVLSTTRLVAQLKANGASYADCGEQPAYPTVPGSEIVCEVEREGQRGLVRVKITTAAGEAEVTDY